MNIIRERRQGPFFTLILAAIFVGTIPASAKAGFNFQVSFDDPGGANSSFYSQITTHALAAGADWASHFTGDGSLEIVVRFSTSIPRATGRSVTSSFVGNNGTFDVFEQGAAAEIRTGVDPNGATPDIELVFNPSYLADELWFDPDPINRLAPVPINRTDAVSVFLHELGHAFAFNGFQNQFDGTFPGNFESTFDEQTFFNGTDFLFIGSRAVNLYGGPVPLTFGNIFHLGNSPPRPGDDLIPDLMNGVVFFRGARYNITPLDLAILNDTGLHTTSTVPAPSSFTLSMVGGMGLFGFVWRQRQRGSRLAAA